MRPSPPADVRVALLLLVAVCAAGSAGCPRRPVRLSRADGGSAVVVVEREAGPAPAADGGTALPVVDEREPNNTLAEAQPLTPGQAVRGRMDASTAKRGDVDYYRLVIGPPAPGVLGPPRPSPPPAPRPAPTTQALASQPAARTPVDRTLVAVQLSGVTGLDLALDVLDEKGAQLVSVNDGRTGAGEHIPNLGLTPGTYHVRIRQAGRLAPVDGTPPYLLTVTTSPLGPGEEIEPNDKPAWATELFAGAEVTGFFGWRRDEDWFRVPLGAAPEGATLRVDLQGVPGVAATVAVHDSIQTKLVEARGGRGDRVALRAVAVRKGEPAYYVVVRAESGRSHEVRYALRVGLDFPGEPTEVEPNDDLAHATPLEGAQGAIAGYIASPGDADWFRLTASAPSRARVEVTCPERVDVKLTVHDAKGAELWRVDEGGRREPEILVTVPVGGVAFVKVTARPGDSNPDEPYRLTWKLEPDDGTWEREPNNMTSSATPWPPGAAVMRGYIHPRGDVDSFRVLAPAERPVKLRASVRPLPRLNLVLALLEAPEAGGAAKPTLVAESKPAAADAERVLEVALAPGKTYYLQLRDGSGKAANPRDSYEIALTIE